MNRIIRLLPDFAIFATLFFVVGIYFDLDLSTFFKGADIALPTALALIFALIKNAKGIHKDALSILESDKKHLQTELQKVEKELGRLIGAIGESSVDKAEPSVPIMMRQLLARNLLSNREGDGGYNRCINAS